MGAASEAEIFAQFLSDLPAIGALLMTRPMADQRTLLADYVANASEQAFSEVVHGYIDLVYSTALRLVNGDTHRAEDVVQTVFADLARLAGTLPQDVMLGGWLTGGLFTSPRLSCATNAGERTGKGRPAK